LARQLESQKVNRQTNLPALLDMVDKRAPSFRKLLPPSIPVDRFISASKTALLTVPGLVDCEPQSVILACMRCAADGLVPDGRKAVLVVGRSKRGSQWVNVAQYWAMASGLQDIVFRTGKVVKLESRVVYQNDTFDLVYGSEARVIHQPRLRDRGQIVGVYAIATFRGGSEQLVEWMDVEEIDGIMRRSKSWNKEKNQPSGPWATDYSEMARKTVLRRIMKYLPSEVVVAGKDQDEGEDEPNLIEGEFTVGPAHFEHEGEVRGGMVTSGTRVHEGDRPAEEPDEGHKVAEAEMLEEKKPEKTSDNPNTSPNSSDEATVWKPRLRNLRDDLAKAVDPDSVEVAWMDWDAAFDKVPTEVTARAKALVEERLQGLRNA
jgi:recombination protein RecT